MARERGSALVGEAKPDSLAAGTGSAPLAEVAGIRECTDLLAESGVACSDQVANRGKLFLGYGLEQGTDAESRQGMDDRIQTRSGALVIRQVGSPGVPSSGRELAP